MLNNIPIGQYIPIDSTIHRIDPRVKIFILLGFMIWILMCKNFIDYLTPVLIIIAIIILSNIPFKYVLKNVLKLKYLFIITWILHVFFSEGTSVWNWGIINITSEGIKLGTIVTIRLICLILTTSLLTLTTSPMQMTDAFEKIFSPLKKIGFPSHEIALMLVISFRFIPILFMEADKIMKAQMCRGVDFNKGNLRDRINCLIPIFVPLLRSSFQRADELATAMEARCYSAGGGDGRTHFRQLKTGFIDYIALFFFISIYIVNWIVLKKY
ncbi:energy-coupling factor transporter transmembrane protein EcfT [Candidatus Desantisbacteria bacterium]|nr:energy-coupling factor transporter transmembrane protein EcfT [Candidatus Desantisbacteria bacterium]